MKILKGEFDKKLELQIAPSIKAGFPSPADDYLHDSLDFNRDRSGIRKLLSMAGLTGIQ